MIKYQAIAFFLIVVFACLSGCSSIMRPPPAAAFMDSYKQDGAVRSVAGSLYLGELDNGKHDSGNEYHYSHAEWWGDITMANFINDKYITFGYGLQTLAPFFQAGFVSPYFGFTGWTNFYGMILPATGKIDGSNSISHFSGGGMAIEQIPLNDKWKLGFTEHISRNGKEFYYVDDEACEGVFICNVPEEKPKFYAEVGGGFYISRKIGESSKISIEVRYGRDLDESRNRIAVTFDLFGFSGITPIGLNDYIKRNHKHLSTLKITQKEVADTADSAEAQRKNGLYEIKRRWIRLPDSSHTNSLAVRNVSDYVWATTTKGICYDESTNNVWIQQDFGDLQYQLSADSMDYCQESERISIIPLSFAFAGAMWLPSAVITGSGLGGLALSAALGASFGLVVYIATDPEKGMPKVYPEICSERHSREELRNWLRQYPCGETVPPADKTEK